MKRALILTVLAVFVSGAAFAQSSDKVKGLDGKVKRAAVSHKADADKLKKDLDGALVTFRREVANLKEPNFGMAFQSMLKVMDAYNDLRKVSPAAASAAAFEINEPFKAGWGETLTVTQFINRESVVLFGKTQEEFDAFGYQLEKDLSNLNNVSAAREVLGALAQARNYISNMKQYNAGHILQSLVSVMDSHNDLRKVNPALAKRVSKEINKPIAPGFGGSALVVSRFVNMECVMVYGDTQNELDAWASAIERDLK